MGAGASPPTKPYQTPNADLENHRSQTMGDKLHSQKGKSPDRRLRSQNHC